MELEEHNKYPYCVLHNIAMDNAASGLMFDCFVRLNFFVKNLNQLQTEQPPRLGGIQ